MQKNWYIIYTKPKCEKKVVLSLTKRKIETFLPMVWKEINSLRRPKIAREPLFASYVFARLDASELASVRSVKHVVNLLYWKGTPATVKNEEIGLLKDFVGSYQDIRLQKTQVNPTLLPSFVDGARYSLAGNLLSIKNRLAQVHLPSVGFTLVGKVDNGGTFEATPAFSLDKLLLQ